MGIEYCYFMRDGGVAHKQPASVETGEILISKIF